MTIQSDHQSTNPPALPWTGTRTLTVAPYDGTFPRFNPEMHPDRDAVRFKRLAIVDTETMGLDLSDPVIEIAVRQFVYDPATGGIHGAVDEYESFHDPGVEIPHEVTVLTGIRTASVRGHRIDAARVAKMLRESHLVVAHNAEFDRPRVELLTGADRIAWACSSSMIDWQGLGLPSRSLGALCLAHGFYSTAHRAMADVNSLARLLIERNAQLDRTYFEHLLLEARRPVTMVRAVGSPFSAKDRLKGRGYSWDGDRKVWGKTIPAESIEAERAWLSVKAHVSRPEVVKVDPFTRFAKGA